MVRRKEVRNVNPMSIGLQVDVSLNQVGIFDHLTRRLQSLLADAKKFKKRFGYNSASKVPHPFQYFSEYLPQVGHKHPEKNLKWNNAPYMWMKRGIAWCVRRGMGLGGKFSPCAVLLVVRGSTCISPRRAIVFKCSTPGSFMTPSDLITASLAKIGCNLGT
ncbi:hypothetical protein P5673_020962 [Acropora cervicornis]|uniref:Uncharacterized protein n=1 Tax=Acropora cervicornis TaxID=6130 RepID=A0AAD9Q9E2_ACRCE|nr:hypothetical protein P5673_020962 [Acropora cervicornis]